MGERVAAEESPERDAQALLKTVMPAAQAGLEENEGFSPLAALIAPDGTVRRIEAANAGAELPAPAQVQSTKEAVAVLRERLRREVQGGAARSAALAADVMIWRSEDGDEASSAVSVHVEHQSGYCVDLLIPYKVRKGMMSRLRRKRQVMFRKMIAQESEQVIFTGNGVVDSGGSN